MPKFDKNSPTVLRNPKHLEAKLDTDTPEVSREQSKWTDMDNSNPPTSKIIPKHPLEEHFENEGPRAPIGHGVSKDHPAIQESEN